jgi:hypothetical protein
MDWLSDSPILSASKDDEEEEQLTEEDIQRENELLDSIDAFIKKDLEEEVRVEEL